MKTKQWDVKWDHNETLVHSIKSGGLVVYSKLPSAFIPSISSNYYDGPKKVD